jgi:ABC-type sugar transport system substrate-binding protein
MHKVTHLNDSSDSGSEGGMSRNQFLRRGAIGATGVASASALLAACGSSSSSSTAAARQKSSPSASAAAAGAGTVAWVIPCVAAWNLQLDIGFRDASALTGWKLHKIGIPCAAQTTVANVSILEQALELKPDLVATPMYIPAIEPVIKKMLAAGIQVVLVNGQIPNIKASLGLSFVGQDEVAGGVLEGTRLATILAGMGVKTGTIIAGNPAPGGIVPLERISGGRQAIAEFNSAHGTSFTVDMLIDNSSVSPAKALTTYKTKMEQLGSKLVGMLNPSAEAAVGPIIQALTQLGKKPGQIPIVSWDTGPNTDGGIMNGWIDQTIDEELYLQGLWPTLMAWGATERHFPSNDVDTGLLVVNRTNLDEAHARDATMNSLAKTYGLTY